MSGHRFSFGVAASAGVAALAAASAPSPLYPVYQQLWHLSAFTLTLIFAVYVFALLAALLTVGSLSDQVGRRPVASAALVLLAVGMLLFAGAGGSGGLLVARVVQGLAVGAATGTITAMIMDSAPGPKLGPVVSSAVSPLGIAIGAVLSGALVEFAPQPRRLVYWILAAVYVVLAALVWSTPERAGREPASRQSIRRSLRPSVGLPPGTRPTFIALLPSLGATWALGGLYLSIGSSVLRTVLEVDSHLVAGITLGAFFAAGAVGATASTALPSGHREWIGHAALIVGVLITIAALLADGLPLYVVGSVVAGLGFGAALRFAVNALGEVSPAARRGEVFATMYIASYLAFSVPALAAGIAVEQFGLEPTAVTYGLADVALVLIAMVAALSRHSSRERTA